MILAEYGAWFRHSSERPSRGAVAGFILVCTRRGASARISRDDVKRVALHVVPANIDARPPNILEREDLIRAVVNPLPTVLTSDRGLCLGALFEEADWSSMGSPIPDGTFAIVRHDENAIELGERRLRLAHHLVRAHR